jgi:hypothetical protein
MSALFSGFGILKGSTFTWAEFILVSHHKSLIIQKYSKFI